MARRKSTSRKSKSSLNWRRIDLHLHTPASSDYQQPHVTYLDILRQAEARGLDIIAFTDHNTVAGYRSMQAEIAELELLERLGRLYPDETDRLNEYRRLMSKILVLPGFEFTAMFGFHILGIFSPNTPVRTIEHVLLDLNVPTEQLDEGASTVGSTTDVINAYRIINEAGGLVIAAHVNSSNGVAMRNFPFGGQTKIAYTQDPNLYALEVTDLEQRGRRTTAGFFNGSKPEYPRRMHCIQGSDAHRVTHDPKNSKNLGIGDRVTETLVPETSFDALKELFTSDDFARTRPYKGSGEAVDFIQMAREEGPSIVQAFHETAAKRGGHMRNIICDVCAMANTNGGTLYIGVSSDPATKPVGVTTPARLVTDLQKEITQQITPELDCKIDTLQTRGKTVVRISVPRGGDVPYAIDGNQIYLRSEGETSLAIRDEIVQLVLRVQHTPDIISPVIETAPPPPTTPVKPPPPAEEPPAKQTVDAPRTGVEIVAVANRSGTDYYTMRDLRNGSMIHDVTRASARRLWHYAIAERASAGPKPRGITWQGDLGLIKAYKRAGRRYDLAQKTPEGMRIYYGVTDDGIHGPWKKIVGADED